MERIQTLPLNFTKCLFVILLSWSVVSYSQNFAGFDPDTVKAQKFDTGKMWTFDYPPVEYLQETYNFSPSSEWLEDVRLSALRIPGCTASFISEDGLIMTNHHCAEGLKRRIQKEGEDLSKTGFYAASLEEERPLNNYYADQLVLIVDVTDEIVNAFNQGENEEDKIAKRDAKIDELESAYSEDTQLNCQVVSLYNGGKYSLYGFKRYTDIRMVFIPEERIGYFGGDYDNFTYPRYNLDFSFLRIYENGEPLKSEHYFKFSQNPPPENDVVFTVGNPGSTQRLSTVAQLEFARDFSYRNIAYNMDHAYKRAEEYKKKYPERAAEFQRIMDRLGNSQKSLTNTYKGLLNPYLIARKKAFENDLKERINSNTSLAEKYGNIWDAIRETRGEMREIAPRLYAYQLNNFFSSAYFFIARDAVKFARQMQLPENEREGEYRGGKVDSLIENFYPKNFDKLIQDSRLEIQIGYLILNLGKDNDLVQHMFNEKESWAAVDYVLNKSQISTPEKLAKFLKEDPDKILSSDDPFIYFILNTQDEILEIQKKAQEITDTEDVLTNMLGQAMFEVYGTSIPPDANFTLRLSDGLLAGFEYNGTIAPVKTTFHGMYDRYYSFDGEYPWDLPERWINPGNEFDRNTVFNFISTNDIVGGNSGSAVIDRNAEVVGAAFDGNIQSLNGNFIFLPGENRCVAVATVAILEALKNIYHAGNLVEELKSGGIVK